MNGILKDHLRTKLNLSKFVKEMDRALIHIQNELGDDYKSRNVDLKTCTHLKVYKDIYATSIFMVRHKMYDKVQLVVEKLWSLMHWEMFTI